jgi:hypothetical protein
MKYYKEFQYHFGDIVGERKKIDNTIYSFDIETSSYLILNGEILPAIKYLDLTDEEQQQAEFRSCMYIWMFSINEEVYYGRTWQEFKDFLMKLEYYNSNKKIVFIHNLSFEFQYLKSVFKFKNVVARKKHKVMKCEFEDYNIELHCSYMMTNCALKLLPKVFMLPVEKKVGDLDYTLLRTPATTLSEKELGYCEYDCLVIYYYIKRELETYERVDKIPITSTGKVRRELKEVIADDWDYKKKVKKAINIDPHIYNLLQEAFAGGYTHANWIYADEIQKHITSWDFTSSYPYILVSHQFPSTEFQKCVINKKEQMMNKFAYLLVVEFKNIKCKYYNNFISQSKCSKVVKGVYDNGRIIEAESITITLTDVDFYFILDTYKYESYEIKESYYSRYDYLPKQFIEFVLEKYVNKTAYKNVEGMEVEYAKEKNKFNSLYGMSVTNMIRDEVLYDNEQDWTEKELDNAEIIEKLNAEKKKAFLSFAYGVWVTAFARSNLLKNVVKLDDYVVYCDTDSMKLIGGYDKKVIDDYNTFVINKLKYVSKLLDIPYSKFSPADSKGEKHILGIFDNDGKYEEFITQGAKKYAYTKWISKDKIKSDSNVQEIKGDKAKVLEITVAGVPKSGALGLKNLSDFKDSFVFEYKYTNKNLLMYCENQEEEIIKDYQGNEYNVTDKSGCCIVPNTYTLGKSLDYADLISDNSSKRAKYKE